MLEFRPVSSSFKDLHFKDEIQRALDEAGFVRPTPIQEQSIPILLKGGDLIGVAQTGTGKTLAFLLPIFQKMHSGGEGPQAVVVCPTRELALQCAAEAERFGRHLGVRTVLAYGGTSSGDQKRTLAGGSDLLVATPGRLLDFLNSAWLSLRRVRTIVLDEADRMLDMGFINDIDAILRKAPMSRQTMLFSATFPEEIRRLSERYMFHPQTVRIDVGTRVKESVSHALYPVAHVQKTDLLLKLLDQIRPSKTLIFTATREGTSDLARQLRRRNHDVVSLSSLLSQANRERALNAYRRGEFRVLVATDVAARGLDITDIDLVVNFDVPMHAEEYVHRIGRTGRAHRSGRAITLVCERDHRRVSDIERMLGVPVPRLTLEGFAYIPVPEDETGKGSRRRGRGHPAGYDRGRPGSSARMTPPSGAVGAPLAAKPRARPGPPLVGVTKPGPDRPAEGGVVPASEGRGESRRHSRRFRKPPSASER